MLSTSPTTKMHPRQPPTPCFITPLPMTYHLSHAATRITTPTTPQQPATPPSHRAISMLRVQSKRRPEDWEKRHSTLSGRFLPVDPRDEAVLDILENKSDHPLDQTWGPEGPPSTAYGTSPLPGTPRKWSKRSEAARKRWADPEYRALMLHKRAEKRRRDAEARGEVEKTPPRLEIGVMDSITLSDEPRAKAINAYARSIKLRSEKISAFHRNRKLWMEERLKDSPQHLSDEQITEKKLQLREKRRQSALKRARNIRAKRNAKQQNASPPADE